MAYSQAFDVAINGNTYLIDYDNYRRRTVAAQREQRDTSADVGEQTLSSAGQWVRSITDWSRGAGQTHYDLVDSDRARFSSSKNIDIFTKGQISLCKALESKQSAGSGTNMYAGLVNGSVFYFSDGQYLKYGNPDAAPDITFSSSDQGAAVTDWTSDGTDMFATTGSAVKKVNVSSTGAASTIGSFAGDVIEFANGRLLCADGARIVELNSSGAVQTFDKTLSGTCIAIKGGPQAIYAAYNVAGQGVLYAISVSSSDGSLSYPVVAAVLPNGETFSKPTSIDTFGDIMIVGTSKGVRFGSITPNDGQSVTFGPVIDDGGAAYGVRISGKYAYWGTNNGNSWKADLTIFTQFLVPAYCKFLAHDHTDYGNVLSVEVVNDKVFFTDSNGELYGEDYTGDLSTNGELVVGKVSYGTVASKILRSMSARFASEQSGETAATDYNTALDYTSETNYGGNVATVTGTATIAVTNPKNTTTSTVMTTGGDEVAYSPTDNDVAGEAFDVTITLARDGTTTTSGPIMERWSLNARPQPSRIEEIIVPVILQGRIQTSAGAGAPAGYKTLDEYNDLRTLVKNAQVVTYEEGDRSESVSVEDLEMSAIRFSDDGSWWEGTCLVRLLTVP